MATSDNMVPMKKTFAHFRDRAIYDSTAKTAISVRDGVLEYFGSEIGHLPADKVFKVYRSPATIANAAQLMRGIPVTNDHVSLDVAVDSPAGEVLSSKMIDLNMPEVTARIGVMNELKVAPELLGYVDAGKRELSLGYRATLVECSIPEFDLEQIDILPHHLAVVDAGRNGSVCSFIDHERNNENQEETEMTKKKDKAALHKVFTDAEGQPSMTEIVAIAQALPEALAALPVDELAKVLPVLQEIVSKAGGGGAAAAAATEGVDDEAAAGEGDDPKKDKTMDAEEPKKDTPVTDSKAFKDAMKAGLDRHVKVMDKARQFLPEDYKFEGKSTEQVMRDAVAVEHGKTAFSDSELEVAFKMMKKTQSQYRNFGDGASTGKFSNLADKAI